MSHPRVAHLLRTQFGVISRPQVLAAGLTVDQLRYLVRRGEWRRRFPNVFVSAEARASTEQSLWAASLYASPKGVLSHASARWLWRLEGDALHVPEVRVGRAHRMRSDGVVVHRTTGFERLATRTVDGLRVTTPEQTVLDAAATIDDVDDLSWMVERLRGRRLVTAESMERALQRFGTAGRGGAGRLRAALTDLDGAASESLLEVKVARVLARSGLPVPERQVTVDVGGQRFRLDFAWTWRRVALECDGRRFHSDPRAFRRDRARWTGIASALGYRIVFATWSDVTTRPEWIVEQVAGALVA